MGVALCDQKKSYMIDQERALIKDFVPQKRHEFEKPRVGYLTEEDKLTLQRMRNRIYGHVNVDKIAKMIKTDVFDPHDAYYPINRKERLQNVQNLRAYAHSVQSIVGKQDEKRSLNLTEVKLQQSVKY